ncbi:WD repeat and HMG-box DNA-binding protein 1-like [Oopsacas minuta]|uniref:WD repeat and HMG-box DNA-binding protein 1-like n=1 Tax=Oopsacas minuta TaxID=111878 RepID=A0AAV7JUK1_9METZ|nr:WD repeat and HMG-box DNA-binding protein 1-like [Oopsacas minuta]
MDTNPPYEEFVTHSEGFGGCIFFSLLGRDYLLSCGSDGDIRLLDLSGEKEPIDLYIGSSHLYQLACVSEPTAGVLFACEDNSLYWINLNLNDFSKHTRKIITRFASAVYCVTTDSSGRWIAAGAADFTIKLIPASAILTTNQYTCHVLDTHSAPVLSLSFSSDGLILCSTSCDGHLIVWCTNSRTVKHKISVLSPKVSDLSLSSSRLVAALSCMTADICFMATPQSFSEEECPSVPVYSSLDYHLIDRLVSNSTTDSRSSGTFHCCAWSPDSLYLAAGTALGHIIIWSCSVDDTRVIFKRVSILRHTLRGDIISVAWGVSNITGKLMLAAFTKSGYLILYESLELTPCTIQANANQLDDSLLDGLQAADLFDSQESHSNIQVNGSNINMEESSLDSKPQTSPTKTDRKAAKKRKFVPEWEEDIAIIEPEYSQSCSEPVIQPEPSLLRQESFQPSSWPPFSQITGSEHVCLCYNLVGVVISHKAPGAFEAESENKHFNFLIEVEFHDRGVHHPLQLIDPHWFSVGVLTDELLVLGGSGNRNVKKQPKDQCLIQVHRFNAWDGSKEWNAQLPEGENALCLAAGRDWIAVVSDSLILRLFGTEGTQFDLLKMPGYPVSTAGRGSRLILVYHQNCTLKDSQNMSYYLLAVSGMKLVLLAEGTLVISLNSELRWIGFTSAESPVILDSLGHLEVGRVNSRGVIWAPMLDFSKTVRKKRNTHKLVILGITPCLVEPTEDEESVCNEEIRYIVPSHGSHYPSLYPRPSVQVVTYNPPFCSVATSGVLSLEQRYFLSTFCYGQVAKQSQEELMRLFALAARSGSFQRALEVGALLNQQYKQLAITYSSRLQLSMLGQKMNSLLDAGRVEITDTAVTIDSEDPSFAISQAEHELKDSPLVPGEEIAPFLSAIRTNSTNRDSNLFSSAPANPFKNQKAPFSRASSIDNSFIKSVIQKSLGGKHTLSNVTDNKQQTSDLFSKQSKLGETRHPVKQTEANKSFNSVESSKPKPNTFKDWLEQTMPQLEADNPTLKKTELIQIATKKWREEKREIS